MYPVYSCYVNNTQKNAVKLKYCGIESENGDGNDNRMYLSFVDLGNGSLCSRKLHTGWPRVQILAEEEIFFIL